MYRKLREKVNASREVYETRSTLMRKRLLDYTAEIKIAKEKVGGGRCRYEIDSYNRRNRK